MPTMGQCSVHGDPVEPRSQCAVPTERWQMFRECCCDVLHFLLHDVAALQELIEYGLNPWAMTLPECAGDPSCFVHIARVPKMAVFGDICRIGIFPIGTSRNRIDTHRNHVTIFYKNVNEMSKRVPLATVSDRSCPAHGNIS